jgi:hypothetical protein
MTLALQALVILAVWFVAAAGLCALVAWNVSRVRMAAEKRATALHRNTKHSDGETHAASSSSATSSGMMRSGRFRF